MPRIIAFFHLLLLLSSITISAIAISAWESFEENDDLLTFNDARTMFCVKCMAKELQEATKDWDLAGGHFAAETWAVGGFKAAGKVWRHMGPSVDTPLSEVLAAKLAQTCTQKLSAVHQDLECRAADLNAESVRMVYDPAGRFQVHPGAEESNGSSGSLNPASVEAGSDDSSHMPMAWSDALGRATGAWRALRRTELHAPDMPLLLRQLRRRPPQFGFGMPGPGRGFMAVPLRV